ncbi:hypothetical protein CY35_02G108100 [Sphagnum magellanicum]|nr:hypothetical protein CY35_02G108100 [Sphagnum magellanicum]
MIRYGFLYKWIPVLLLASKPAWYNGSDIWSFTKWKKDLGANCQATHPHKAYWRGKDVGVKGGVVRWCGCAHGHLLDAMQVLLLASKPTWYNWSNIWSFTRWKKASGVNHRAKRK